MVTLRNRKSLVSKSNSRNIKLKGFSIYPFGKANVMQSINKVISFTNTKQDVLFSGFSFCRQINQFQTWSKHFTNFHLCRKKRPKHRQHEKNERKKKTNQWRMKGDEVATVTINRQRLSDSEMEHGFPASYERDFAAVSSCFTWWGILWLATKLSWFARVSSQMQWSDIIVLRVRAVAFWAIFGRFFNDRKNTDSLFSFNFDSLSLLYFCFRFFSLLLGLVMAILWLVKLFVMFMSCKT